MRFAFGDGDKKFILLFQKVEVTVEKDFNAWTLREKQWVTWAEKITGFVEANVADNVLQQHIEDLIISAYYMEDKLRRIFKLIRIHPPVDKTAEIYNIVTEEIIKSSDKLKLISIISLLNSFPDESSYLCEKIRNIILNKQKEK